MTRVCGKKTRKCAQGEKRVSLYLAARRDSAKSMTLRFSASFPFPTEANMRNCLEKLSAYL